MTKIISKIGIWLTALLVFTPAFAQIVTPNTTLSSAVTASSQTLVSLTSGTGVVLPSISAAGTYLYVDTEAMQVTGLLTGTTYTVQRGVLSTLARTHASGALVWVGNVANGNGDSSRPFTGGALISFPRNGIPAGTCTASAQYSLPVINTDTGVAYTCYSGFWQAVNTSDTIPAPIVGTTVVAAATIVPTANVFHVSGTTAIVNITVPPGFAPSQCLTLIPDALGSTTSAGNIGLGSTFVVSKALFECWDGTKFRPSY